MTRKTTKTSFEDRYKAVAAEMENLKAEAKAEINKLENEKADYTSKIFGIDLKIGEISQSVGLPVMGSIKYKQPDSQQEANERIAAILSEVQKLVHEAEGLAEEWDLGFSLDVGGYGMGGYYDGERGNWNASSQNC